MRYLSVEITVSSPVAETRTYAIALNNNLDMSNYDNVMKIQQFVGKYKDTPDLSKFAIVELTLDEGGIHPGNDTSSKLVGNILQTFESLTDDPPIASDNLEADILYYVYFVTFQGPSGVNQTVITTSKKSPPKFEEGPFKRILNYNKAITPSFIQYAGTSDLRHYFDIQFTLLVGSKLSEIIFVFQTIPIVLEDENYEWTVTIYRGAILSKMTKTYLNSDGEKVTTWFSQMRAQTGGWENLNTNPLSKERATTPVTAENAQFRMRGWYTNDGTNIEHIFMLDDIELGGKVNSNAVFDGDIPLFKASEYNLLIENGYNNFKSVESVVIASYSPTGNDSTSRIDLST